MKISPVQNIRLSCSARQSIRINDSAGLICIERGGRVKKTEKKGREERGAGGGRGRGEHNS